MTLIDRLNRMPPWLCRFVARTGWTRGSRPMTNTEIAQRGGLNRSTVLYISKQKTWNNVRLEMVVRFADGCGVNLMGPGKQVKYLQRRAIVHVRNARGPQRRMLDRLLKLGQA